MKMAQEMMKNMSPEQIKQLMEQAKSSQNLLRDQVKAVLDEEINRRQLVSRDEVVRLIAESRS